MGRDATSFGYAAFTREDVEDAKRRHPDVDLSGYAASRGLWFQGRQLTEALIGHLPRFADYVFNSMGGALPGGHWGIVEHELHQVGVDQDGTYAQNGSYYGARHAVVHHRGAKGLVSWATGIDVGGAPPDLPFEAAAVWVPTTRVALRLSCTALMPSFEVRRGERGVGFGNPKLDDVGAPGYRMLGSPLPAEVRPEVFAPVVGPVLASLPWPVVDLVVRGGAISVMRNGYARSPEELDAQVAAACHIADGLAAACARWAHPQPFEVPLGPFPAPEVRRDFFPYAWGELAGTLPKVAAERGLATEDPYEYHQVLPANPAPGIASGVVGGWSAELGRFARLAFHRQPPRTPELATRGVVSFVAPLDAPAFPLGGQFVAETAMLAEVVDGVAYLWSHPLTPTGYRSAELVARARRTAEVVGLAPG